MEVSFVGDISFHGVDEKIFKIDSNIINVFSSSDLVCGNLENPITKSDDEANHAIICLKSNDRVHNYLKHFDVVNLCNNHIFDFGVNGFKDTVEYLNKNNIKYFGAGSSQKEAQNPFCIDKNNGNKIAIIGGKLIPGPHWPDANSSSYGTAGNKGYKNIIKRLKEKKYFIIYFPHWGYEYIKTPPPNIRSNAKKMIDLGVDLIIGSHPHVLQGYEKYKNKYIFYSIGNFIFDVNDIKNFTIDKYFKQTTQSIILNLTIINNKLENFKLLPINFTKEGVFLSEPVEKIRVIEEINEMSAIFKSNYLSYCYQYYSQTPDIIKQNQRIYQKFDTPRVNKKQTTIQKIKLMTLQGLLNRMAAKLFSIIKSKK